MGSTGTAAIIEALKTNYNSGDALGIYDQACLDHINRNNTLAQKIADQIIATEKLDDHDSLQYITQMGSIAKILGKRKN